MSTLGTNEKAKNEIRKKTFLIRVFFYIEYEYACSKVFIHNFNLQNKFFFFFVFFVTLKTSHFYEFKWITTITVTIYYIITILSEQIYTRELCQARCQIFKSFLTFVKTWHKCVVKIILTNHYSECLCEICN